MALFAELVRQSGTDFTASNQYNFHLDASFLLILSAIIARLSKKSIKTVKVVKIVLRKSQIIPPFIRSDRGKRAKNGELFVDSPYSPAYNVKLG